MPTPSMSTASLNTRNLISDTIRSSMAANGIVPGGTPNAPVPPAPTAAPDAPPPTGTAAPDAPPPAPAPAEPTPPANTDAMALLDKALGLPPVATVAPNQPAEPSDPEEVVPTEVQKDPRAAHAWAKKDSAAKEAARQAREALAAKETAERRVQELEAKATELENKSKGLEETLGKVSLEADPNFQTKYDGEIERMRTRLSDAFKEYAGADPADAAKWSKALLSVNQSECTELMDKMRIPPFLQGVVISTRMDVSKVLTKRSEELTNWKSSQTAYKELQAREFASTMVANREKFASTAVEKLRAGGNWMLEPGASPEQADIAARRKAAIVSTIKAANDEQIVELAADGLTAPAYRALAGQLASRVQELEAQIRGMGNMSPSVRSAPVNPQAPANPNVNKSSPISPSDFVKQVIPGLQAGMRGARTTQ